MMKEKIILLIGGTGSLGYALVKRYISDNIIYNYSRDECKHWKMGLDFNQNKNLHFVVGDVIDHAKLKQTILRVKPNIILIACAMKHIDQCEYNIDQCLNTNLLGTKNILDITESCRESLVSLETILFVSSDKACSPINAYGMCKALSENLMIEKSFYVKDFRYLVVRYGNVLNSRGSIIPLLHNIGNDPNKGYFTLTSDMMTRFVMTLDQSVDLINHAVEYGKNGEIVIPELVSMNVVDLIKIFSEIYNKPIKLIALRPGEKMLESLINESQSARIRKVNSYTHIKSFYEWDGTYDETYDETPRDYNSKINPLNGEQLKTFLEKLGLLLDIKNN